MTIAEQYDKLVEEQKAKHKLRHKQTDFQPPSYAGFLARKAIAGFFKLLFHWRLTVFWLLVAGAVYGLWIYEFHGYAVLGAVFFVLINLGAISHEPFRKWCIGLPDYQRMKRRRFVAKHKKKATEFIIQTGLIKDVTKIRSTIEFEEEEDRYLLHWRDEIPGKTDEDIARECMRFVKKLEAVRAYPIYLPDGFDMLFFVTDPLDKVRKLDAPPELDEENMSVECAVNSLGLPMYLTFKNQSGMVIGGIPGSGKTGGATSFTTSLALSKHVNVSVIDGKGAQDWESYGVIADKYIRGDEDLEPIAEFMEKFHIRMLERAQLLKDALGVSNFWNASAEKRAEAGIQFELLLIDECQGLFEDVGRSKDEKDLQARIQRICSSIVKRGRGLGLCIIFMTQKPTAKSLPTDIRDNCGLFLSFRVKTDAAEISILGEVNPEARANKIPKSRVGGAVLANDQGDFEQVRFYYIDEKVQEKHLLKEAIHRPPREERAEIIGAFDIEDSEAADGGFGYEVVS